MRGDNLIYTTTLDTAEFEDNGWVKIKCWGKFPFSREKTYRIDFCCYDGDAGNCISLYRTEDRERAEEAFAMVREYPQDYNLCVRVFGATQ